MCYGGNTSDNIALQRKSTCIPLQGQIFDEENSQLTLQVDFLNLAWLSFLLSNPHRQEIGCRTSDRVEKSRTNRAITPTVGDPFPEADLGHLVSIMATLLAVRPGHNSGVQADLLPTLSGVFCHC
jgi:hypothetical protein